MFNNRKIVCLCGSTKFKEAFEKANKEETAKGNIVLTVAMFGHLEGLDMDSQMKKTFDEVHFDKILLCDEVLVLNVNGYIGDSTKNEIEFAIKNNKIIRYLEVVTLTNSNYEDSLYDLGLLSQLNKVIQDNQDMIETIDENEIVLSFLPITYKNEFEIKITDSNWVIKVAELNNDGLKHLIEFLHLYSQDKRQKENLEKY
ncbi:hypothetical protein AMYT_a0198 (plasmid) [Malaciobacter mytili LMG 24559]|nr:hypothetical protein AMYT_a0198 [Malaciobacter mytili LMG 24559]